MQHSRPTLAFKALMPLLPTLYLLHVHSYHCHILLVAFLYPLLPLPTPTLSVFYNEMLGVSEPEALNYYTLFRLILLTLCVSRNLTLIHLPLSGSLDSLLCNLIAPTPVLAFFLPIPSTLGAASSFSLDRAYPYLNFVPPLFLRLTPTLIM